MNMFKKALMVLLLVCLCAQAAGSVLASEDAVQRWSISWESRNQQYKHLTDLGNYTVMLEKADFSDFPRILASECYTERYPAPSCTAVVKRNSEGQVIVGRNMDVEISQTPAYITEVTGGRYETVCFSYGGSTGRYRYDELDKLDEDDEYRAVLPYTATDAMNEAGLYVECNMREMDDKYSFYCNGTNPGKERACLLSAPVLIALNCATVDEAVTYMKDSYDWYTLGFRHGGDLLYWNLAMIIGDAYGNYGLLEVAKDNVYYTPYANGQGNYYIHPSLAEYAANGSGYGRLAAALENVEACETADDMMKNMEACMWKREVQNPGCMAYSDYLIDVNARRATSEEDMQKGFEEYLAPFRDMIEAYYSGDETALRDDGRVWTTSFNFGVNCSEKYLKLRLWERDDAVFEYNW